MTQMQHDLKEEPSDDQIGSTTATNCTRVPHSFQHPWKSPSRAPLSNEKGRKSKPVGVETAQSASKGDDHALDVANVAVPSWPEDAGDELTLRACLMCASALREVTDANEVQDLRRVSNATKQPKVAHSRIVGIPCK